MSASLGQTIVPASASALSCEVGRVAQRLEHTAVVEQVGEVKVGRGAVLEPDVRSVPVKLAGPR
jgi:hypothetical protein